MTEDQQATENYFTALGWEFVERKTIADIPYNVWIDNGVSYFELPYICQSYPDFKREVLERMDEKKYTLVLPMAPKGQIARWHGFYSGDMDFDEPIKDNEILRAAVVAATRYLEEEK